MVTVLLRLMTQWGMCDEWILCWLWVCVFHQHLMVREYQIVRQKKKINCRKHGNTKVWYFYDQNTEGVYIFIVFSLSCDTQIYEQPMCDKSIDKSTAVRYKDKQNKKRAYFNGKKTNVWYFQFKLSGVTNTRQEFTVWQIKSHFPIVCRFSLFSL